MATQTNSVGISHPTSSCVHTIMESRWTDVALLTSFAAFFVIGILASSGVFNSIGAANAVYLSYGMYASSALFLSAEIVKIAIKRHSTPNTTNNVIKSVNPLSQEEVQNLKREAKVYAQNKYRIFVDPTPEKIEKAQNKLYDYLINIIDKAHFQKNPVGYMTTWREERGGTEEFRYPEDTAHLFFVQAVGKIRTLPQKRL
jgi:hypothetical protein